MNILVTGAAGFIGSHLVDFLIKEGHFVRGVDDLKNGTMKYVNKKSNFVKGNLDNLDLCKKVVKNIDIIYHLAADAASIKSLFTPIFSIQRNLNPFVKLIIAAAESGVKKIVFTSSMAVYGNRNTPPFTEDMSPEPKSIYGICKLAMEQILKTYNDFFQNKFSYTILRLSTIYGPRLNLNDPYRHVVSIFIQNILKGKPLIIYGDGNQKRTFAYIQDVIPAIAKAGLINKTDNQILNIGSMKPITINELANLIKEIFGKSNTKIYHKEKRPLDPVDAWCDVSKAKELLGFSTKTSLYEGLKKTIAEAKNYPLKIKSKTVDFELLHRIPDNWLNNE